MKKTQRPCPDCDRCPTCGHEVKKERYWIRPGCVPIQLTDDCGLVRNRLTRIESLEFAMNNYVKEITQKEYVWLLENIRDWRKLYPEYERECIRSIKPLCDKLSSVDYVPS